MDSLTRALVDGLYRHVRRMLGDAAFDEGSLRLRGAPPDELEHLRGRLGALRDVLDLFDAVIGEPTPAVARPLEAAPDRR
jgi:hypothetical protein